ncbi:MAG: hypothetical protein ACC645_25655 [Pirellulales bacterium]
MKGVSLLVALATLGVDTGWDAGPSGQLLYTIRIEPVLLEPMRTGQPVVSGVDAKDRRLRGFQIVMDGPDGTAPTAVNDLHLADNSEVQYGWRPAEGGGLEYLIQITPERLERLAKGAPLVGEVLREVSEVHRFHISVGVGQLPRTGLTEPMRGDSRPPDFLNVGETPPPPTDRSHNAESRFGIPNVDNTGRSSNTGRFESQTHGRIDDRPSRKDSNDGAWRSESFNSPARGDLAQHDRGPTQLASNNEETRSQPHGQFGNGTGARGPYRDNRVAEQGYSQRPAGPPLADPPAPMQQPASYPPQTTHTAPPQTQPPPAQPPPTVAPRWPQTPANEQPSAPTVAWRQPISENVAQEADAPEPWMPLILTTFALFASLGANAYIGWLAWSFFWRYRQAADDLERARSTAVVNRQAA